MVFLEQRQLQHRPAGHLFDRAQGRLQAPFRPGRGDEPEIVAVLTLVIVIHFGKAIDHFGNRGQLVRGYRHRGQRTDTDTFRGKNGADARDLALATQPFQGPQHHALGNSQPRRQLREGRRTERKIPLKVIEKAKVDRFVKCVHQKPMRLARLVKNIPLGACTSSSPSFENVAVS